MELEDEDFGPHGDLAPATPPLCCVMTYAACALTPVSGELASFADRHLSCSLRALEAGGGGDCLFHAWAAGLTAMIQSGGAAAAHVLAKLPIEMFTSPKDVVVCRLRAIAADSFDDWSWEEFLTYVLTCVTDEETPGDGGWRDNFRPTQVLQEAGLREVFKEATAVRAVSDAFDGDPGDLVLMIEKFSEVGGRAEFLELVEQGWSRVITLHEKWKAHMRQLGNHHWGTTFDLRALAEHFRVGAVMFASELLNGGKACMSSLDFRYDKVVNFEYHMLLHWQVPCHFQLCECRTATAQMHQSFFASRLIPDKVKAHYNICNRRAPIGAFVSGHSDIS